MNKINFVLALNSICKKFTDNNPNVVVELTHHDDELHLSVVPSEKVRRQWVKGMVDEMNAEYPCSKVVLSDPNRKIVVLGISDGIFSDTAVALCSPQDEFDATVGVAVAYAKWMGYPIPEFI